MRGEIMKNRKDVAEYINSGQCFKDSEKSIHNHYGILGIVN